MYRAYLRWPNQRVSDKTATPNPQAAEVAFRELLGRTELNGQKVAAVLSLNNRQLMYHRFDRTPDCAEYVETDDEIKLHHD